MTGAAPSRTAPGEAAQLRPASPGMARSVISRAWDQPLWVHAAFLLLGLLALLPLMSPHGSFSSDEGAYALQVEALENGAWEYDYKAAPYDPEGRYFPVYLSTRSGSDFYTYVKHPAYPLLVQVVRAVVGPTLGLHLLALLGTVGTAVAAWLLAAEINPRLSRPAFWLAAGGPALVNGFLVWAHAPSAALAGLALVGAARIARNGCTPLATAGVAAALVAGVLLRTEAILFGAALAGGLAFVRLREGRARSLVPLLLVAAPLLAAAVERRWVTAIIGRTVPSVEVPRGRLSYLEGRLAGAGHELFSSPGQHPEAALPVVLALVLVAGLGWLALRRWNARSGRDLTVAVAAAVVLLAVRVALRPYAPVTGLFAAWPLGLLGLLLVRWRRTGPAATLLGTTVALFAAAVVVTQYPEGGATEWGGRFLSPTLAPLAALASAGLAAGVGAAPAVRRRWTAGLLVLVGVAFAAFGLVTVGLERARIERVAQAIARHPAPVTVTTGAFLPRAAWSVDDRVSWMRVEPGGLAALVRDLRAQGVRQVAAVLPAAIPASELAAFPTVEERPEPDLAGAGLRLLVARS